MRFDVNSFAHCNGCNKTFYLPLSKARGPEKECVCTFKRPHLHLFCSCGEGWIIEDPRKVAS